MEADEAETSRIKEPHQLYDFANKHLHLPHKHIIEKKGRAIYRRHFHCECCPPPHAHVGMRGCLQLLSLCAGAPIVGGSPIDRRIKHCNTLKFSLNDKKCGIKKLHQITDLGKPGVGVGNATGSGWGG